VTSSAGLIAHRNGSAYCASKAASNHYLAALRIEVYDRGVGVSWVCPGVVRTPFIEKADLDPKAQLPRLNNLLVRTLEAAEVSRAVLRAVERNRAQVALPPVMTFFAALRRLAPRTSDWLQRKTG
jgi:short-subunit dehydrogenase